MQFDFGTIDPETKSGAALADDLNRHRDAIHTTHLGPARPSYVKPGMLWLQQVSESQWLLMLYCALGDIQIAAFDPTTGIWDLTAGGASFTKMPQGPVGIDPDTDDDLARKKYVDDKVAAFISAGTQMLFLQNVAPTGWTKITEPALNHALRLTGGTAGWGGSMGFTSAFTSRGLSGSVDNTTLAEWQMPSHLHDIRLNNNETIIATALSASGGGSGYVTSWVVHGGSYWGVLNAGYSGGGGAHGHGLTLNNLNMSVAYADVIVAYKN